METAKCTNCDDTFSYLPSQTKGKFCSNACQHEYRRNTIFKVKFYNGELTERKSIKKYLSEDRGYSCSVCGLAEWNNKHIVLQLDHIDGNAGNNKPENLRLICPNCHSQTEYFSGSNRGNGRKSRGLPRR